MKTPTRLLFAAILFALAACDRSPKTDARPAPDVVGNWEWTDKMGPKDEPLFRWRLEFQKDGAFRREISSKAEPKPEVVSGHWTVKVIPLDSATKDSTTDELMKSAGHDPAKSTTEYSALATLTLNYTVPEGTKLQPGATVLEPDTKHVDMTLKTPPQTSIAESHSARTRRDKSDKTVYLDIGKKTFVKLEP